jgi:hypothetical protein
MWLAVSLVAIVATGVAFLLWFLLGLLWERGPSRCYWLVPTCQATCQATTRTLEELNNRDCEDEPEMQRGAGDYYVELLEKPIHENPIHTRVHASGLIALEFRPMDHHVGWRSIPARRGVTSREGWLRFQ